MAENPILDLELRKEIVTGIFGDIGELAAEDFSCAWEQQVLVHGRMYLSNKALCFYSNLFGVEKKLKLSYSEIKWWSKINTAIVIPNGIEVKTESETYQFRSFINRNRAFQLLDSYINKFYDSQKGEAVEEEEEDTEAAKMNVFQSLMNNLQRRRSSASKMDAAATAVAAESAAAGGAGSASTRRASAFN